MHAPVVQAFRQLHSAGPSAFATVLLSVTQQWLCWHAVQAASDETPASPQVAAVLPPSTPASLPASLPASGAPASAPPSAAGSGLPPGQAASSATGSNANVLLSARMRRSV